MASKSTGWLSTGPLGVNVKLGFRPSGGTTMPGGTRRMAAVRGVRVVEIGPDRGDDDVDQRAVVDRHAGAAGAV